MLIFKRRASHVPDGSLIELTPKSTTSNVTALVVDAGFRPELVHPIAVTVVRQGNVACCESPLGGSVFNGSSSQSITLVTTNGSSELRSVSPALLMVGSEMTRFSTMK